MIQSNPLPIYGQLIQINNEDKKNNDTNNNNSNIIKSYKYGRVIQFINCNKKKWSLLTNKHNFYKNIIKKIAIKIRFKNGKEEEFPWPCLHIPASYKIINDEINNITSIYLIFYLYYILISCMNCIYIYLSR